MSRRERTALTLAAAIAVLQAGAALGGDPAQNCATTKLKTAGKYGFTGLTWEKLGDDGGIHDADALYAWKDAFSIKIGAL